MMHSLELKSTVTGSQDKESALKEPTIKGYGNYHCPHLVRAARGRKSPFFDFKRLRKSRHHKYKCPIVENPHEKAWTIGKEKEHCE